MTTKHTPGPWTADECTDHDGYRTIRPGDGTPNGDIHAEVIATVYEDADAQLIAAAPELLEALRTLYRDVEFLIEDGTLPASARNHAAMSEARAAIQKAEGR